MTTSAFRCLISCRAAAWGGISCAVLGLVLSNAGCQKRCPFSSADADIGPDQGGEVVEIPAFVDPPDLDDLEVASVVLVDSPDKCVKPMAGSKWVLSGTGVAMNSCISVAPAIKRCTYRWTDGDKEPDYKELMNSLPQDYSLLGPDHRVVMPLGPKQLTKAEIEKIVSRAARNAWTRVDQQIEAITKSLSIGENQAVTVTVAVIDTTPGTAARPSHGDTMVRIIRNLKCYGNLGQEATLGCKENTACRDTVKLYPALDCGDRTGTFSSVANSIVQAVDEWNTAPCGKRPKLIINLSIGWSPKFDSPGAELVHNALCYASSQGATIVAATGNTLGHGDCDVGGGPLYPARWEKTDMAFAYAEKDINCIPVAVKPTGYAPLLHGVAALDDLYAPLANTRTKGLTRLAAPGMAVSVPTDRCLPENGAILTGTSASAAIASGIAALIWQFAPEKTGPQIIQLIYEKAPQIPGPETGIAPTPVPAEWYLGPPPAPIVRGLSVGRTLWSALSCGAFSESSPCYAKYPYQPATAPYAWIPDESDVIEDFSGVVPVEAKFPDYVFPSGKYDLCHGVSGKMYVPLGGESPDLAYPDQITMTPKDVVDCAIEPQPGRIGCPDCSIAWRLSLHSATVYMTPTPEGMTVLSIALKIMNRNGSITTVDLTSAVCGTSACSTVLGGGLRFIVNVTNLPDINPSAAQLIFAGREPDNKPVSVPVPLIFLNPI